MVLDYSERKEVEEIVERKLDKQFLLDSFYKLLDKLQLESKITEESRKIVPRVGQEWVNDNLKKDVETRADNYMKNNFLSFFKKEVQDNQMVNGFISTHLDQVKIKVEKSGQDVINRIVGNDPQMNPVFQSHLSILGERNRTQLDEQMKEIRKGHDDVKKALDENNSLRRQVNDLKSSNKLLTALSFTSLMATLGFAFCRFNGHY
jgi:hypothetical protein